MQERETEAENKEEVNARLGEEQFEVEAEERKRQTKAYGVWLCVLT